MRRVVYLKSDFLLNIQFKDVGQGDSIILEWEQEGRTCIGLIDCNLYKDANPVVDYLVSNSYTEIDFIILSHFHYDHFSGMAELFEHLLKNKIRVKYFYHTLIAQLAEIYDAIFTSKRIDNSVSEFIDTFERAKMQIDETIIAHHNIRGLRLNDDYELVFHSPISATYDDMARQLSRKKNKIVKSSGDINKLATIIVIKNKKNEAVLLTSDAVQKSFQRISNTITSKIILVQVPHHGSWTSIFAPFWQNLDKKNNCPAIFSVGYEPKDELPNHKSVEFFDKEGFNVHSTNSVYGITSYFGLSKPLATKSSSRIIMATFAKYKGPSSSLPADQYNGDKTFSVL